MPNFRKPLVNVGFIFECVRVIAVLDNLRKRHLHSSTGTFLVFAVKNGVVGE
jgi:hypothetical protein